MLYLASFIMPALILALVCNYLPLVSLKAPAPPGVLVPHLLDRKIIPALPTSFCLEAIKSPLARRTELT